MPQVSPAVLKWARETAGLSLAVAARALSIGDARGKAGAERLAEYESGVAQPTRALLSRMAQKYHRSLVVFYLDSPPRKGDRGRDFRFSSRGHHEDADPGLDALIRDVRSRHDLVRSIMEDEDARPLSFVGSAPPGIEPRDLAGLLTEALSFDLSTFRAQKDVLGAFAYLREAIEGTGVFVILAGNLGSHHSNIPAEAFRGYAIADPVAPMIVINDQDAKSAWAFTALHELAHVWLGATGVSGQPGDQRLERLCDDVSARILLPRHELVEFGPVTRQSLDSLVDTISQYADARHVSRSMVALNLLKEGLIEQVLWTNLATRFRQDWEAGRATKQADERRQGPSYYVLRRHRMGSALLGLVNRALREGAITHTMAGRVLGVKARNVEPLLHGFSGH